MTPPVFGAYSPPFVKRSLQLFVCLLTALHLVGGHWGVLQMVAWARMLNEYTAERGLITGVMETFDGQHCCAMCRKIAAGKNTEQKQQQPVNNGGKQDFSKWYGISPGVALPRPRWSNDLSIVRHAAPLCFAGQWDAAPPLPPPERLA